MTHHAGMSQGRQFCRANWHLGEWKRGPGSYSFLSSLHSRQSRPGLLSGQRLRSEWTLWTVRVGSPTWWSWIVIPHMVGWIVSGGEMMALLKNIIIKMTSHREIEKQMREWLSVDFRCRPRHTCLILIAVCSLLNGLAQLYF